MQHPKSPSTREDGLRIGAKGIFFSMLTFAIAGKIMMEGRHTTGSVWIMMGFMWMMWGLADILPSHWPSAIRLLRVIGFVCSLVGLWFATQI